MTFLPISALLSDGSVLGREIVQENRAGFQAEPDYQAVPRDGNSTYDNTNRYFLESAS